MFSPEYLATLTMIKEDSFWTHEFQFSWNPRSYVLPPAHLFVCPFVWSFSAEPLVGISWFFAYLKKYQTDFSKKNLVLGFFDQKGAKLAQKVLWKVSVLNISSFSLKGTASFKVFGPNRTEMDPKWGFSSFMKNGQFDFSDNCIKLQKHRSTKLT